MSDRHVQKMLLQDDYEGVARILNEMFSASPEMMEQFRRLHKLPVELGLWLQARSIPSAVKRVVDSLSRGWVPVDARASQFILRSRLEQYSVDP